MPKYEVKFIEKYEAAEDTVAYRFERPEGFDYQPGQHVVIHLDVEKSDKETGLRDMTLASSPTEEYLEVVMRQSSSPFKQKLVSLQTGDVATMFGPTGLFVLDEQNFQPIIMIAGGIGVTPFRSIIRHIVDKSLPHKITLFYSNPTIERTTFKKELDNVQNNNIRVVYTLTEQAPDSWIGEQGRISLEMVNKYVSDIKEPLYYVCGPSEMVHAIEKELLNLGVSKEQIREEEFTGY